MHRSLLLLLLLLFSFLGTKAQTAAPHVLVVMAHPDDESMFSVTLYKIAREQHGVVDLFVITNGEAGYKYSTLAEQYYKVELTNEQVGRENLPKIRKQELRNAGKILGVTQYYFEDQKDAHYTLNEKEPLDSSWNVPVIKQRLTRLLLKKQYDVVFCVLPGSDTHGQHKAASLLALDAVAAVPANRRPVILGGMVTNKTDPTIKFSGYKDYQQTQTLIDTALFKVDRTASFSYKNRISYKIIANWELAEHKSQGATQMTMNDGDYESFWFFAQNDQAGIEKCKALFNLLHQVPYLSKVY